MIKRKISGSSLIESLYAAGILLIIIVGMTVAQGKLYQLDSVGAERSQAALLLSGLVESQALLASSNTAWSEVVDIPLSFARTLDAEVTEEDVRGYCWQLTVVDINTDLKDITAEIYYQDPAVEIASIDPSRNRGGEPVYRIRTVLVRGGEG